MILNIVEVNEYIAIQGSYVEDVNFIENFLQNTKNSFNFLPVYKLIKLVYTTNFIVM